MYNFIKYTLLFVLALGVYTLINTERAQAVSYTVLPGPVGCVKVYNGGTQPNGQTNIRFYNACPEDLYINACVLDTSNNTKLYPSGRRVQTNGNFTISTFPDQIPRLVTWTAGNAPQGAPDICRKTT